MGARRPWVEDYLWWKTTISGRQPLVVTPPLDSHSTTEPQPELLSAVSTRNRIFLHRKMYAALKEDIFRQRRLNHYDIEVRRGKDNWTNHALLISKKEYD